MAQIIKKYRIFIEQNEGIYVENDNVVLKRWGTDECQTIQDCFNDAEKHKLKHIFVILPIYYIK